MKNINGCIRTGRQTVLICSVCFGAGILLSLFLPPVVLVIILALLICLCGTLSIIGGR